MTGVVIAVVAIVALNIVFAATVILLRVRSNHRSVRFGRIEATWESVIVGVIGGDSLTAFQVPEDEADHVIEICGRFARRLRGPDRQRVQEFAAPLLDRLLPGLEASSPETRGATVELLGVLGPDSHGDLFVLALSDPSPRVSLVAARALLTPDNSKYLPDVLLHLHRYVGVSRSLMSSMLAHVGVDALDVLRGHVSDDSRPTDERAAVAGALRLLRDLESAEIAADGLGSDDPELVVALLRLVGSVGSSEQAAKVRPLLQHSEFFIRAEAATVIGRIGSSQDVSVIISMTEDDSPWVAIRSARALLDLGERSVLEGLAATQGLASKSAREVLQLAHTQ